MSPAPMYANFFGLSEAPFNITPDPRFLYLNGCYQEALAALTYGIDARKGFITVIGEAGTGKTTLLRRLLDSVAPSTRTVLLLNPTVTFDEILEHILIDLGIPTDGGKKLVLLHRLNEFLLEHTRAGGNVALLIDEAQDLQLNVLEELRLLSNLETAREKILQIVLAGQPELETILEDPRIRQLRQRITMPIRIRTLSPAEVGAYIRTRLERVGGTDPNLFTPEAVARIAAFSEGIPRLVNVLCDASMLAAFVAERRQVTPALVEEAWADFAPRLPSLRPAPAPVPAGDVPATDEAPAAVQAEPGVRIAAAVGEWLPAEPAVDALAEPNPGHEDDAPAESDPTTDASTPRRRPFGLAAAVAVLFVAGGAALVLLDRERLAPIALPAADAPIAAVPDAAPPADAVAAAPEAPVATPAAEAPLAAPDAPAAARPPTGEALAIPAIPAGDGPLSSDDAGAVLAAFRAAFEARDATRIAALFTEDAAENGRHGREAIAAGYRVRLEQLTEVRYTVASLAVAPRGEGIRVHAPFAISYRQPDGRRGEIHGEAEWALERRDGRPVITALHYRLDAPAAPLTAARTAAR